MQTWNSLPGDEKYAKMARQGHGFVASMPARVIKTDVPDDHIEDVEKNGKDIGEIVFYGNICAKGYYKDEEATRKLFAGGVLHTGDLAVMHEDGAIQILDRAKDIIISGMHDLSLSNSHLAHIPHQEERTSLVLLWSLCWSLIQKSSKQPA